MLRHLVEHADRVVPKTELLDAVWGDRFVSESALTSRVKSARRAVGDDGDRQQVIKTIHGVGYRLVAEVEVIERDEPEPARPEWARQPADGSPAFESKIQFVSVRGDTALAVAETGAGPCLVKAATWLTQVDRDTERSPIWGHWVRALSRRYRYVRYDPRGCGLSDRDIAGMDLTDLDLWVDDLSRVIDTLNEERVALLGVSQGGPVAMAFAARHPNQVSHLILYGTYARGMKQRHDPIQAAEAALQVDLARVGWATRNDVFRETFARQFVPDAQSDEIGWFNDQLRMTTNPANAPLLEGAFHDLDATDVARLVSTPTMVLHALGDRGVPFEEGRHLAGLIPGARFVALESNNHILLQRDAAFPHFINDIEHFLAS